MADIIEINFDKISYPDRLPVVKVTVPVVHNVSRGVAVFVQATEPENPPVNSIWYQTEE